MAGKKGWKGGVGGGAEAFNSGRQLPAYKTQAEFEFDSR